MQTRNQGGRRGGRTLPYKIFRPNLEKCFGHSSNLLDIVQKIWAPLKKLFAPLGIPSWLRGCQHVTVSLHYLSRCLRSAVSCNKRLLP